MAVWNTLFDDALRKIGRVASGGTGTATERADAMAEVNRLLGRWNAELGPIYGQVAESLTWASGNASRTIGSGGDLNTTRPQQIILAQYRDSNNLDTDLAVLSHEEYQAIPDKATTGDPPQSIGYNPAYTSARGTLFVYPVPTASFTLRLTSIKPMSSITDATADSGLPPGMEDAVFWNLIPRLCSEYGIPVDAYWMQQAYESKKAIEQINSTPPMMWPDMMAPGMENSYSRDPVE